MRRHRSRAVRSLRTSGYPSLCAAIAAPQLPAFTSPGGTRLVTRRSDELDGFTCEPRVGRVRGAGGAWSLGIAHAGPQGLGGIAGGRSDAGSACETAIAGGYGARIVLLSRPPGYGLGDVAPTDR